MTKEKYYTGKVILFGEYTVLFGGQALAVPYQPLRAIWSLQHRAPDPAFVHKTSDFGVFLEQYAATHHYRFDHDRFRAELLGGLSFYSNIPIGYGCGSSGAWVVAIAERYLEGWQELSDGDLKLFFGGLESFFHGTSSGVDPFVIYKQQPVWIDGTGHTHLLEGSVLPVDWSDRFALVDSGRPRATDILVQNFRSRMTDARFAEQIAYLRDLHDAAIASLLRGQNIGFDLMNEISHRQYEWLDFLIPDQIRQLWVESFEHSEQRFKLCGAGGGGFFLKITYGS